MNKIFKKVTQKTKRRIGVIVAAILAGYIVLNPTVFLIFGADIGIKIFKAIFGLILTYGAISQMDRHWSHPDSDKEVSLSRFMKEAEPQHKVIIYAVTIFTIGMLVVFGLYS